MSDIWKAVLKGQLLDQVQIRTIFYVELQLEQPDTVHGVVSDYISSIFAPIGNLLTSLLNYNSIEYYRLLGSSWDPIMEEQFGLSGIGTGEAVANLVSAVLIGKAPGKRHMGRKFISGLLEGPVSGNALVTSAMTAFTQAAAAYITPVTTTNGSVLAPGVVDKMFAFHAFSTGWVSSLLGTQRRRKPGLGI